MAFSLEIKGLNETIKRLKDVGLDIKDEVSAELANGALLIEKDASRNAPKNMGRLAQLISTKTKDPLNYEVVSPTRYSAYMEFGTKKKAKVPPGFEGYARQFQGPAKGDFGDLLLAIVQWVKRKQLVPRQTGRNRRRRREDLELNMAWNIAINIARNGVNPQPFMYPALQKYRGQIVKKIQRIVTKRR